MFTFISIANNWIYLYRFILCFLFPYFFLLLGFLFLLPIGFIEFVLLFPLQCFGRYSISWRGYP